ncbi:MAG: phosphatidylglycerophosphatase A [Halioglobus sp.]|nr:phosphatidylglycerophosphatase A [Halioglobus sp.]
MQAETDSEHPAPRLLTSPAQLLAFGFGAGLSPKAPGTVGTVFAVALYLIFAHLPLWQYTLVVLASIPVGIWVCGVASRQLGVHDHPGIVWDEFSGYWITMWAVPAEWLWIIAGFATFRIFDIIKPWPIRVADRRVGGGLGIMLDDIMAGLLACLTLHIALALL